MKRNIILNHNQIVNKIKRIAFQILETNIDESQIIIAGIKEKGFELAQLLKTEIENISNLNVILCEVVVDKKNPTKPISASVEASIYESKSLVLVDDVLNSGTTLIYAVKHFLNVNLKQFKTAVLVNRNHKKYPIKADFKGISLSTSLHEHVEVELTENDFKAFLI